MPIGTEIDRIYVSLGADLSGFNAGLERASQKIDTSFNQPFQASAASIESLFGRTFSRISAQISDAAESGKFSFGDMVNSILRDLQRVAVRQFIQQPLNNILNNVVGNGLSFGGARASGGAVSAGRSFLVGENGPELFVPNMSGQIHNGSIGQSGAPMVINFNFPQGTDVGSFQRSEGQISAMLARVVSKGQRNF